MTIVVMIFVVDIPILEILSHFRIMMAIHLIIINFKVLEVYIFVFP